jgi:hypothetical protein
VLQQLLAVPQQLLGADAAGSSSSSEAAEARAAEAFAWLLGQRQQLLVCPDEATAKAVFQAVWCSSSSEQARAAYVKFLGWCGMAESQSGRLTHYCCSAGADACSTEDVALQSLCKQVAAVTVDADARQCNCAAYSANCCMICDM